MRGGSKPRPLADRFWRKVDRAGPDDCWLWRGHVGPQGYGRIHLGGGVSRNGYAHRVSLQLAGIDIPPGYHVDHLCESKTCVNPAHLEPVTPGRNIRRARGACE